MNEWTDGNTAKPTTALCACVRACVRYDALKCGRKGRMGLTSLCSFIVSPATVVNTHWFIVHVMTVCVKVYQKVSFVTQTF